MASIQASRSALPRVARTAQGRLPRQARFQSTTASSASGAAKGNSSHFASGLAGGVAAGALLYGVFLITPSGKMHRTINKGAKEANQKYQEAAKKLQQSTPDADQAIKYIREFCYSYVGWIPGGRQYVDTAFEDIEILQKNHSDEVTEIVNDTYKQLQKLSKSGSLSLDTASKVLDVLADASKRLGSLAGDAFTDILDNHPQAKEKLGGSVDQIKQLGERYGPEAQKMVDDTWKQVRDIMGGGFSVANLDKARKVIEEKVEQLKKYGEEAWKTGLEQAKPYLEKNPKVKELVENNAEALKQGNAKELFDKARSAVESGDVGSLEDYVNKAVDKAKSTGKNSSGLSSFGLDQYFDMIPNGSEILTKVNQLKQVAEKHKGEGEELLKETMNELKQVLEKKSEKAKEIAEKSKKEAK